MDIWNKLNGQAFKGLNVERLISRDIHSRIIRMRMTNDRDGIGACVSCEGLYKAESNVAAAQ